MSYVITLACLSEQFAKCVEVCPVDCIYPGTHENKPFMVIDPELCINCKEESERDESCNWVARQSKSLGSQVSMVSTI